MFEGRKILWVAGGRHYNNEKNIEAALYQAILVGGMEVLITGSCPTGADFHAERIWKSKFQRPYVGIPAQWTLHGKPAGYIRNSEIAHIGPDELLAFPGGKGTQHATDLATELKIDIVRHDS